jgi:hypothetical protein
MVGIMVLRRGGWGRLGWYERSSSPMLSVSGLRLTRVEALHLVRRTFDILCLVD